MIRTYKRKLKLTRIQEQRLRSWIGAARTVYNLALEIKIDSYKKFGKTVGRFELESQLKELRRDIHWMNDVPFDSLSDSIKRLHIAYEHFFKGAGFPKFASKKNYKSITFRKCITVKDNKVKIPNVGRLKTFKDKPVDGNIKLAHIVMEPTGFFVNLVCENVPPNYTSENNSIGLDMGVKNFCIDSNGGFIPNPKHFKLYERKLRIENRSLARKNKFSNSWYRQSKKLALLHHKIANVRKDFLHKQSTLIAKANSTVYLEKLNVKAMVRAKNLSKHILDAGWSTFKTMLEYKTLVIAINPAYTSQTCFECKAVDKLSRLSQSKFVCTSCGHIANADVNAAKNLLGKGIALDRQREALACA